MRAGLFFAVSFLSVGLTAQVEVCHDIPVQTTGGDEPMQFPWAGGFNNPQFSEIDINFDDKKDLFIFDRGGNIPVIMERLSEEGEDPFWQFTLEYRNAFPPMIEWALMHDYDCDGLPDIFTYFSGGAAAYRAVNTGGSISYELAVEELSYQSTIEIPIYVSPVDLPGLADVDGDGDMDIVAFSVSGTVMRLFENQSADAGYGCDSLIFLKTDDCWGDMVETATCDGADLSIGCFTGGGEDDGASRIHVGSTILLHDWDKDMDVDVIMGDVSCENVILYTNEGSTSFADMGIKDSVFPEYDVPAKMKEFPGAYLVDMDLDGSLDLLVSPNDDFLSDNINNVLWYRNVQPDPALPDSFEYMNDLFFTLNTIDAGDFSRPVFFDADGDGLLDIVVGWGERRAPGSLPKYGLQVWRNDGSAGSPSFSLWEDDYLGMSIYGLRSLAPAFGDVDGDGDEDLMIGHFDGSVSYHENLAGPGNPPEFDAPVFFVDDIDIGQNAIPLFMDVDGDGVTDLVLGEENGNLNYFRQVDGSFILETENWGGVDVRTTGDIAGYSAPFLYEEGGEKHLLVGSVSGRVFHYTDIGSDPDDLFTLVDSTFLDIDCGRYVRIAGADLNSDGEKEWLTGNIRGGLTMMRATEAVSVSEQELPVPTISVFPNPADGYFSLSGFDLPARVNCFSLTGALVRTWHAVSPAEILELQGIPAGIYMVSVSYGEQTTHLRLVIL